MRQRNRRSIVWIVLGCVIVAALLTGGLVVRNRVRADDATEAEEIVTVFVGDLSTEISASGRLLPKREAKLSLATSGQVDGVNVSVGDKVSKGDVLVTLASDDLKSAVQLAEQDLLIQQSNLATVQKGAKPADIAAAKAALRSARAQLDDLLDGPSPTDLAEAEAAVVSAQAQLDDLQAGPDATELKRAKAGLAGARASLDAAEAQYAGRDDQLTVARRELDYAEIQLKSAQYFYDALANDWQHKDYAPFSPEAQTLKDARTNYEVALARYNLSKAGINDTAVLNAQAQVAQAQEALAALTEPKIAEMAAVAAQLAQANSHLSDLLDTSGAQVAAAQERVAQAEARLAALQEGASEEQLAVAKAQVAQAEGALEEAKDHLAQAALTAPFDGVVTEVYVTLGEWATGVAAELVDLNSAEVILDVDEVDTGSLAVSQPAVVTLEAWPDRQLQGTVISIAPKAQAGAEIVQYQVRLKVDLADLPVRTGMTANANIVTANLSDVLLVSNRAIIADRQSGLFYVNRLQGSEPVLTEVKLGKRDSDYTQILDGLSTGDRLLIKQDVGIDFSSGPPRGFR